MRSISFIFMFLLFQVIALAQPCLPEGIVFSTQAQIDSFQINYPGCTEIEGDVVIDGADIANLNGLSVLTSIEGSLFFGGYNVPATGNPNLTTLSGLENLMSIGNRLYIINNDTLNNISGLSGLTFIGDDINIKANESLSSLIGLEGLTSILGNVEIGDILYGGNPSLTSLSGLDNVTSIEGDLWIEDNNSLTSLTGLEALTSIGGGFFLRGCDALIDLTGLEALTTIFGTLDILNNIALSNLISLEGLTFIEGGMMIIYNDALSSLAGLEGVTSVGEVHIEGNDALINLTGLDGLTFINGFLEIWDNDSLTSLTGLEGVTSINGYIWIEYNHALTSLTGLDNIEPSTIKIMLGIGHNYSLSTCEVESVCAYLANPTGDVHIHDNAIGCNSQEEVQDSCEANAVSISERYLLENFNVNPNPFTTSTTLSYTLDKPAKVNISIFNPQGQLIEKIVQEQPKGEQQVQWNAEGLPAGFYIIRLRAGNNIAFSKLLLAP